MAEQYTYTSNLSSSNTKSTQNTLNTARQTVQSELSTRNSLIRRAMNANGIYDKADMDYNGTFYRYRRIDPYYTIMDGTKELLFFVKPDLNILDSGGTLTSGSAEHIAYGGEDANLIPAGVAQDTYFNMLYKAKGYRSTVLQNLCHTPNNFPFIRMLSNRKSSNMDIPDIIVDEMETAQNLFGTRIYYPKSSLRSDEEADFSIEFEDTQYLDIYHLFKAYDHYRNLKWEGLINPRSEYIFDKVLHDHMGIFKFLIDCDGETILYWAYATGVYPKTISRSAFSEIPYNNPLKITVSFKLSGWFIDMDPVILVHFNLLMQKALGNITTSRISPIWDEEISAINGESLSGYYITQTDYTNTSDKDGYVRYIMNGVK